MWDDQLVASFEVLANPVRVRILDRLSRPAFIAELASEFKITRQAVKPHLDALSKIGLVNSRKTHHRALPALSYSASPEGLFAFKESVSLLALPPQSSVGGFETRLGTQSARERASLTGPGLLIAHGEPAGKWFPLTNGSSWVIGRGPRDDISLSYDPFASTNHARIAKGHDGSWRVFDLQSTNGTFVNFEAIPSGGSVVVDDGDVVSVGRSRLVLRGARK